MSDLSQDLKIKLKSLFEKKQFSQFQFEIELLGKIEEQPKYIVMGYAGSLALNKFSKKKDLEKAAYLFNKAYISDKSNLEALYNLNYVSFRLKSYKLVLPHLLEKYSLEKKNEKVVEALARFNFFIGNTREAQKYYRELLELNPKTKQWIAFLQSLNYTYDSTQEEYLNYCLKYSGLNTANNDYIEHKNNKKINIGFVSPDLKKHSVSFFLKDVIEKINKDNFKIHAFSNLEQAHHDEVTEFFKENFDKWNDTYELSDQELKNLVRSCNIDILIDLAGFTKDHRINIFNERCAPIQISWLGYCNSLGVHNMDYIIADPNVIKKKEKHLYLEKILYMPNMWCVGSKIKNLPPINILPYKTNSFITFGSFNNFQKISDDTIRIWTKILNNTKSKLILKSSIIEADSKELNENLLQKFYKHGLIENKISILNRSENFEDHLKLYNKIDVALDTFPYPGVTTSFESILMGVPVLTMKGFNFNSRCGESINLNLKLSQFIGNDEEDYYLKAFNMGNDLKNLENLRSSLRTNAMASSLFDVEDFTESFSAALKKIWAENINK